MTDTVTLETVKPSETRLSSDGSFIYSADPDGFLRVYDTSTGSLANSWKIGQSLGGMDVSPDGSFLIILDRNVSAIYRVDTATGAKTTYFYAPSSPEGLLFDVAILSNGTALFTQNFSGSGYGGSKILDLATGTFAGGALPSFNQSSVLTRSPSGDFVFVGEVNSSAAPIDIYQTGNGVVARGGASGYNWGIQAFSGNLAAQYIYNEGIHIYDSALHGIVTLTTWNSGAVTDLAFSPDGKWLYVLDNQHDTIVKVSTTDWDIKATIPVGVDIGFWNAGQLGATNGSRLLVDPQQRFFSAVTNTGLILVANPDAPPIHGTASADVLKGSLFADTLTGGAGVDRLTGGSGADTFKDTAAGLNGDTITDFSVGDKIVITDANIAAFSYTLSQNTLTYTGGSLTLSSLSSGAIVAQAAAGGGVELTILKHDANNDFNGDGRSDLLLRSDNGLLTDWLGTTIGGFSPNDGNLLTMVDLQWQIVGTGDFNGDGRDDVLWRRGDGALTNWLGTATGSLSSNGANLLEVVNPQWQVAGVGDFNGDGRDDVLWRRADGALTNWLGTVSGGLAPNGAKLLEVVDPQWQVAGVGDFNGDGIDDVLWRRADGALTNWLGTTSGGLTPNASNLLAVVDPQWKIVGVGDFNGDGKDDVLWHRNDGALTDWLGTASGGLSPNGMNLLTVVPTDWQVAAIGDYNGDAFDDILWRNDDGGTTDWLGTDNGAFTSNAANFVQSIDLHWHVQPTVDLL